MDGDGSFINTLVIRNRIQRIELEIEHLSCDSLRYFSSSTGNTGTGVSGVILILFALNLCLKLYSGDKICILEKGKFHKHYKLCLQQITHDTCLCDIDLSKKSSQTENTLDGPVKAGPKVLDVAFSLRENEEDQRSKCSCLNIDFLIENCLVTSDFVLKHLANIKKIKKSN